MSAFAVNILAATVLCPRLRRKDWLAANLIGASKNWNCHLENPIESYTQSLQSLLS